MDDAKIQNKGGKVFARNLKEPADPVCAVESRNGRMVYVGGSSADLLTDRFLEEAEP